MYEYMVDESGLVKLARSSRRLLTNWVVGANISSLRVLSQMHWYMAILVPCFSLLGYHLIPR